MTDQIDRETVMQAHNALHIGEHGQAHELLHKALGVDNDAEPVAAPLAHIAGFDKAFITACRKHGVSAAYVLMDKANSKPGQPRILCGGEQSLAAMIKRAFAGMWR